VAAAATVVAVLVGVLLRSWLLAHMPLNSDEAVVGLMARAIAAGHFSAFYWGQSYGGAESYVVVAVQGATHGGPMGLNATAVGMAALAAGLTAAIVWNVTSVVSLSALAGALAWVWPYAALWNSVQEYGFRGVCLACGLIVLLCAVRVHARRAAAGTYLLLGVAAGVGWWSSPEILYFLVPSAVLLLCAWRRLWRQRAPDEPPDVLAVALVVGGAALGALPWIWANVGSGFASVHGSGLPQATVSYGTRLSIFFRDVLPMQVGLRGAPGGAWVGGDLGKVLYMLVLLLVFVTLVLAANDVRHEGRRGAPVLAAMVAVVVFPFLYAAAPTASAWVDGRYGGFLPPLLILLAAGVVAGPAQTGDPPLRTHKSEALALLRRGDVAAQRRAALRRRCAPVPLGLILSACVVVAAAVSSVAAAHVSNAVPVSPTKFFSGWGDPDQAPRATIAAMQREGIRYAFGDYWTAYVLDELAPTRVSVSPSAQDYDRWQSLQDSVARSRHPAWLFFAPSQLLAAAVAFANPEPGPGGYTEAQFEALLRAKGVPYRVVHLGVLDAVIPAKKVELPPAP